MADTDTPAVDTPPKKPARRQAVKLAQYAASSDESGKVVALQRLG